MALENAGSHQQQVPEAAASGVLAGSSSIPVSVR